MPGFASLGGASLGGAGLIKAAAVAAALAGAGTLAALNAPPLSSAQPAVSSVPAGSASRWNLPGFSSGPSMATYLTPSNLTAVSNTPPASDPTTSPGEPPATPDTPGSGPQAPVAVAEPASLVGLLMAMLMLAAATALTRKRGLARAG